MVVPGLVCLRGLPEIFLQTNSEEAPSLIGALGLCSRWYAGGFFAGVLSAGSLSVTRMAF